MNKIIIIKLLNAMTSYLTIIMKILKNDDHEILKKYITIIRDIS